jgi:hypothetical protein
VPYGYIASMKTKPGQRDDVVAILLSGAEGLGPADELVVRLQADCLIL